MDIYDLESQDIPIGFWSRAAIALVEWVMERIWGGEKGGGFYAGPLTQAGCNGKSPYN